MSWGGGYQPYGGYGDGGYYNDDYNGGYGKHRKLLMLASAAGDAGTHALKKQA